MPAHTADDLASWAAKSQPVGTPHISILCTISVAPVVEPWDRASEYLGSYGNFHPHSATAAYGPSFAQAVSFTTWNPNHRSELNVFALSSLIAMSDEESTVSLSARSVSDDYSLLLSGVRPAIMSTLVV